MSLKNSTLKNFYAVEPKHIWLFQVPLSGDIVVPEWNEYYTTVIERVKVVRVVGIWKLPVGR